MFDKPYHSASKKRFVGFTLIEVLIVLGLLGIIASLVVFNADSIFDRLDQKSPEEIFLSACAKARKYSMQKRSNCFMTVQEQSFVIKGSNLETLETIALPNIQLDVSFLLLGQLGDGFFRIQESEEIDTIVFHPSGTTPFVAAKFNYDNYEHTVQLDPFSQVELVTAEE